MREIIESITEWKVYRSDTTVPDVPAEVAFIIGRFSTQINTIIAASGQPPSCLCCRSHMEVNEHKRVNPGAMVVGFREDGRAVTAFAICHPCAAKPDGTIIAILKPALNMMMEENKDGTTTRH